MIARQRGFLRQRLERGQRRGGMQRAGLAAVEIQHADRRFAATPAIGLVLEEADEAQRHADDVPDAEREGGVVRRLQILGRQIPNDHPFAGLRADPHGLGIKLRLNGQTMQSSSTKQMIFSAGDLVAYLALVFTLEPGDLIYTGTPPGVGFARQPPVFLKAGDVCEVEIEKLGILRNPVVQG